MTHTNSDGVPIKYPQGPPTFITLLKEWLKEDPDLRDHVYLVDWNEGTYIQTRCGSTLQQKLEHGYALALFPNGVWYAPSGTGKSDDPGKISVFYHGDDAPRIRGYLRREDPLFFDKLRENLIIAHDGIQDVTSCKIKYTYDEIRQDRENATNQSWWEKGRDL